MTENQKKKQKIKKIYRRWFSSFINVSNILNALPRFYEYYRENNRGILQHVHADVQLPA